MPRVVGLDRDEACDRVQAAQLVCDDRPVPEAPAGTDQDEVVHQEPAGGRAPVFSAVVVEYYAPDPIPVPDLDDLRVASGGDAANGPACQTVVQAGFTCQPRVVAAADGQPADEVLPSTQQPRRGADELPGEDVAFDYAPSTLVPPLTGMTATEACAAVTALNLYCAVDHVTVGATPGQVTSQTPAPGTEVPADSPVARSQVTVQVPQRISQVPEVRGQDQATACGLLAAESLQCSWEANPVNSIRNPNVADAQSIAAGTPVAPGTVVSVFHPAGPDVNLQQFRAYTADGRPLERWAMAPDAGPGRNVYDMFLTPPRNRLWRPEGSVGRCYSTQVEGSSPLSAFMRRSPDDPDHERHFYSDGGPGDEQYERGVDYYGAPTGVLCYVIPWNAAPGATHVSEWWKDQDHYYTPGGGAPGAGFTQVFGHWMTW